MDTPNDTLTAVRAQHENDSKNAELLINLGETALRYGDRTTALESFKRATELDPRGDLRSMYAQWLGMFHEQNEELEDALEAYQRWSELDPGALDPLDRQANILVQMERWTDLALLRPFYLRLAAADIPRARESLALLSYALNQIGHPEEANPLERTYSALESETRSPTTRYLLGTLLYRAGQLEGAQREFARTVDLARAHPGWVELRLGLHWDATSARLMLARLARERGQLPQALALLQSIAPGDVDRESLDELSTLLLDNGHYQELLDLLPEADGPSWMRRNRAQAKLGLGQLEEAASELAPQSSAPSPEFPEERLDVEPSIPTLLAYLREHSASLAAWDALAAAYLQAGERAKAQLAVVQAETLRQRSHTEPRPGFFCLGFRFLARSAPGKANLRVTGPSSALVEPLARFAMTLLQERCDTYSLEDPGYCDLHLHVACLGRTIGEVSEEAGAAILATLAWALRGGNQVPPPRWTLLGRLELDGALEGPVDVEGGLAAGQPWMQLVLPRSAAPDLLAVGSEAWLGKPILFAQNVDQILEALLV
jgi:tetratricopeptide (TPR) repeat protein